MSAAWSAPAPPSSVASRSGAPAPLHVGAARNALEPPAPLVARRRPPGGRRPRRLRHHPLRHRQPRLLPGGHRPRGAPGVTVGLEAEASAAWSTNRSSCPSRTCSTGSSSSGTSPSCASPTRSAGPSPVTPAGWASPSSSLLEEVGVQAGADQLVSRSVDGWTAGTPTAAGDRRPRRHDRHRHERRAPPGRARLPGPPRRAGPLRLHVGHQVADRDGADDLRRLRRLLGAAGLGPGRPHQDPDPHRHPPGPGQGQRRTPCPWAAWPGPSTVASRPWRSSVDDGPWQDGPAWVPSPTPTPGGSGSSPGTPPRVATPSPPGPTDASGEVQTEERAEPIPDGARGWHSIVVTSRDRHGGDPSVDLYAPALPYRDGRSGPGVVLPRLVPMARDMDPKWQELDDADLIDGVVGQRPGRAWPRSTAVTATASTGWSTGARRRGHGRGGHPGGVPPAVERAPPLRLGPRRAALVPAAPGPQPGRRAGPVRGGPPPARGPGRPGGRAGARPTWSSRPWTGCPAEHVGRGAGHVSPTASARRSSSPTSAVTATATWPLRLDLPEGTVKSRIRLGLAKLADRLEASGWGSGHDRPRSISERRPRGLSRATAPARTTLGICSAPTLSTRSTTSSAARVERLLATGPRRPGRGRPPGRAPPTAWPRRPPPAPPAPAGLFGTSSPPSSTIPPPGRRRPPPRGPEVAADGRVAPSPPRRRLRPPTSGSPIPVAASSRPRQRRPAAPGRLGPVGGGRGGPLSWSARSWSTPPVDATTGSPIRSPPCSSWPPTAPAQPGARTGELTDADDTMAVTGRRRSAGPRLRDVGGACPALDGEHTYQLWAVDGGTPVSLGPARLRSRRCRWSGSTRTSQPRHHPGAGGRQRRSRPPARWPGSATLIAHAPDPRPVSGATRWVASGLQEPGRAGLLRVPEEICPKCDFDPDEVRLRSGGTSAAPDTPQGAHPMRTSPLRIAGSLGIAAALSLGVVACGSDSSTLQLADTTAAARPPPTAAAMAGDLTMANFGPGCAAVPTSGAGSFDGHGRGPGRHRRLQQPGALHPRRRGQGRRPGRHPQRRGPVHHLRPDQRRLRQDPRATPSTASWPIRPAP